MRHRRSTLNALKALQSASAEEQRSWDARALREMKQIWEGGIQVEWVHFSSFLEWMIYSEEASAQTALSMLPHVVDTAANFLSFLASPTAALAVLDAEALDQALGNKDLERQFQALSRGGGAHRFKATMLTIIAVVVDGVGPPRSHYAVVAVVLPFRPCCSFISFCLRIVSRDLRDPRSGSQGCASQHELDLLESSCLLASVRFSDCNPLKVDCDRNQSVQIFGKCGYCS